MLNWLDQSWRDLRFAARGLVRARGFTALAVMSLALGDHGDHDHLQRAARGRAGPISLQRRRQPDECQRLEPCDARISDLLFRRSIPRDRRAEPDLRGRRRVDDQRCPLDRRRRSAAAAGEPRHVQHVRRHGRAAAPRTDADGERCAAGCGARGGAGLPFLAASVRRRSECARPPASPQRQRPHGDRDHAETVHVARGGCLPAHCARTRPGHRRRRGRAPARPAETRRDGRRRRKRTCRRSSRI